MNSRNFSKEEKVAIAKIAKSKKENIDWGNPIYIKESQGEYFLMFSAGNVFYNGSLWESSEVGTLITSEEANRINEILKKEK